MSRDIILSRDVILSRDCRENKALKKGLQNQISIYMFLLLCLLFLFRLLFLVLNGRPSMLQIHERNRIDFQHTEFQFLKGPFSSLIIRSGVNPFSDLLLVHLGELQ
jgi:hypothetical protein